MYQGLFSLLSCAFSIIISPDCGCPGLPEGPPDPSGSVGGGHGPRSRLRSSRWASPLARIDSLFSRLITTLYEPVTPSCCPPVYGLLESLGNNSLARVTSLARCRLVDQVCTPTARKSNSQTISQVSILVGAQARCGLVPSAIWSVCWDVIDPINHVPASPLMTSMDLDCSHQSAQWFGSVATR